ncbi:MAG: molybdopterin synthase sulfur carrier subunit [Gemmatimonadetes bacterium]|jgi:molybdopterin synthase sulfur carrier subunit|nr:MAG: molybdopterin synthase sulfur carrier subunit [Gemmatimonadota bacterium]
MPITVNIPTVLAGYADGQRAVAASGRTLGEVVADLAVRYPQLAPRLRDTQGNPYPFVVFYLNDEDSRFRGGFQAPVQDGDEVTVVPAIAGG